MSYVRVFFSHIKLKLLNELIFNKTVLSQVSSTSLKHNLFELEWTNNKHFSRNLNKTHIFFLHYTQGVYVCM